MFCVYCWLRMTDVIFENVQWQMLRQAVRCIKGEHNYECKHNNVTKEFDRVILLYYDQKPQL